MLVNPASYHNRASERLGRRVRLCPFQSIILLYILYRTFHSEDFPQRSLPTIDIGLPSPSTEMQQLLGWIYIYTYIYNRGSVPTRVSDTK